MTVILALLSHISDMPSGTPSLQISKSPLAVNEDVDFTCQPVGDAGLPEADHFVYYEDPDGEPVHNDTSPWTTNFDVVKDDVTFYCSIGNYVGTGEEKGSNKLAVEGWNRNI